MSQQESKPVGLTQDIGWQVGARRTHEFGLEHTWALITSQAAVRIWLGEGEAPKWDLGARYTLANGTAGEVRVFKPNSHLRVTYFPPGWPRASTIQLRTIPSGSKTQISFHQEHLPNAEVRAERKRFFLDAHEKLTRLIEETR